VTFTVFLQKTIFLVELTIKKNGGQRSIINIHLFPSFVSVVF